MTISGTMHFLLIITLGLTSAFTAQSQVQQAHSFKQDDANHRRLTELRGGSLLTELTTQASVVSSTVTSNLQAGPYGVLALAAVASGVLLPITQIKNFYAISVGYGLSVAAMGFCLRSVFAPAAGSMGSILTASTIAYGVRLGTYLFIRDQSGWKPAKRSEPPRVKRFTFALSLAFFYAFMTTPVMYALRHPAAAGWPSAVATVGAYLSWTGAALEATADAHKFIHKMQQGKSSNGKFTGPISGVYRITRHPNYTGEVLFWLGTFVAGAPSFGQSIVGWVCSAVGLYGIVSIMRAASKGLEERQQDKYGGQSNYEDWKAKVKAPLVPFVSG